MSNFKKINVPQNLKLYEMKFWLHFVLMVSFVRTNQTDGHPQRNNEVVERETEGNVLAGKVSASINI